MPFVEAGDRGRQRERDREGYRVEERGRRLNSKLSFFEEIVSKGTWRPKIIESAVNPAFRFKKNVHRYQDFS